MVNSDIIAGSLDFCTSSKLALRVGSTEDVGALTQGGQQASFYVVKYSRHYPPPSASRQFENV